MLLDILDIMGKRVSLPYDRIEMITEDNQGFGVVLMQSGYLIETSHPYKDLKLKYDEAIAEDLDMLFDSLDEDDEGV